ncbi:MAG: hypothetical protein J6T33_05210 [Bacteroidales bacterium]|nr:hypothetical protein [Bacteroidales bacterium]
MEKTEFKSIDKYIYELPDIRKRLRPIYWAWGCVLCGMAGFLLNRTIPTHGQGLSALIAALVVVGIFGAGTIVAYYLIGDCKAPYYKPLHRLLTREYFFYSRNEKSQLFEMFDKKDMAAIDKVKKSALPDYTLVRYSDKDEKVYFAQIFESKNGKEIPATEVIMIKNDKTNS